MEFDTFLKQLLAPSGIGAAAGIILSLIVDYWPKYQALSPKMKRLVFFGICLAVPLAAATALVAFGYEAASWQKLFWFALQAGVLAGWTGTAWNTQNLPTAEEKAETAAALALYRKANK
jgi:hypothetical protein